MKTTALFLCCCATVTAAERAERWRTTGFRPWRIGAATAAQWAEPQRTQLVTCLGTLVELDGARWPKLARRPIPWASIQRWPRGKARDWTRSRSLGRIAVDAVNPRSAEIREIGPSHAVINCVAKSGKTLTLWASRTTPAIVCHTDAASVRFFAGQGSIRPRFFAQEIDGKVKTGEAKGGVSWAPRVSPWLLVWFGHGFDSSRFSGYMPYYYPADCPLLFFFGRTPRSVSFKDGMRIEAASDAGVGHVAMVPPFGDSYPLSHLDPKWLAKPRMDSWHRHPAEFRKLCYPPDFRTDDWYQALPAKVVGACRWWAEHLHEVPISASESFAYDATSDTATVTEKLSFVRLRDGGSRLAPLPPTLALAKEQGFPVEFSGPVVTTSVLTAHGPYAGIEGVEQYEWRVKGLRRYALNPPPVKGTGKAPQELLDDLEAEVAKILDAGDLAPWYPVLDDNGAGYMGYYDRGHRGHFVFGNPGETLYHLADTCPFLKPATQKRVVAYLKDHRKKHPPEKLGFLLMGQGAPRERYRPNPPYINARLNKHFAECSFYLRVGLVPVRNLYHLARYYEVAGETGELKAKWKDIRDILTPYLANLDWGSMGLCRRPVTWHGRFGLGGVIDMNSYFAGLVGGIRLARMAGDQPTERRLWGELAKTAALRFAMGKYASYLYQHGLMRAPTDKGWMMRLLAGSWRGYLYTANWRGIQDEIQQIWQMDQFGVYFREYRIGDGFSAWPGILTFIDPVPELGRFFRDHLRPEAEALMRRAEEAMPAWYTVYCPCVQASESSFQPPEDAHQLFLLRAWVLDEGPERLAWLRSVPWLARGDLFYLQKLIETIRAYRGRKPGVRRQ